MKATRKENEKLEKLKERESRRKPRKDNTRLMALCVICKWLMGVTDLSRKNVLKKHIFGTYDVFEAHHTY